MQGAICVRPLSLMIHFCYLHFYFCYLGIIFSFLSSYIYSSSYSTTSSIVCLISSMNINVSLPSKNVENMTSAASTIFSAINDTSFISSCNSSASSIIFSLAISGSILFRSYPFIYKKDLPNSIVSSNINLSSFFNSPSLPCNDNLRKNVIIRIALKPIFN